MGTINLQLKASSTHIKAFSSDYLDALITKVQVFCDTNPNAIIRGIEFIHRPSTSSTYKCVIIYTY